MKKILSLLAAFTVSFAATAADTAVQTITYNGEHQVSYANNNNFTGTAIVTALFDATKETRSYGAIVTFEPGAHTAWHSHTLGQKLIVTDGVGYTQYENGQVEIIKAGDVVVCPPGIKHWHGAALNSPMTHIAIGEKDERPSAVWYEKISEQEYADLINGANKQK
ncbi:(R)-mandelonitrile lyase [Succinatimonas hippei]|uniref:(R)-mandelonitrile lyase n=1 Tax=Succinatimonas hippei TaxID=626938 RepID=UPI0024907BDD|nr:cupin domain-containing protein [Succinatimonas hippei]